MTWGEKKKIKIQSVRSKTNVNLSNAKSKEREGERERRVPWRFDERNEHLLRVRGSRANSEYNKQRRRVPLQPPFPPLFPLPPPPRGYWSTSREIGRLVVEIRRVENNPERVVRQRGMEIPGTVWNNGSRITKAPRQSCASLKEVEPDKECSAGKNWLPIENGRERRGRVSIYLSIYLSAKHGQMVD